MLHVYIFRKSVSVTVYRQFFQYDCNQETRQNFACWWYWRKKLLNKYFLCNENNSCNNVRVAADDFICKNIPCTMSWFSNMSLHNSGAGIVQTLNEHFLQWNDCSKRIFQMHGKASLQVKMWKIMRFSTTVRSQRKITKE